ncbi:MAG: AAA family ATPase [Promethearchaeota archaeon]
MNSWVLEIENIGGFENKKEFLFKKGLNLIVGDNATGKTTIVNALKLLNNLKKESNQEKGINDNENIYRDFLHNKTKFGKVRLKNELEEYQFSISSPIVEITSFLDGESPKLKLKKPNFLSKNPKVVRFAFIDKNNKLMEEIEYSGNIGPLMEEIARISNVRNYKLLIKHSKKLYFEYKEKKEKEIKELNDQRKEIDIKIQDLINKIKQFESELDENEFDETVTEELKLLKKNLEEKNNRYNIIKLKKIDKINEEINKLSAKIERDEYKLRKFQNNKNELDQFINLENSILENEKKIQEYDFKLEELKKRKESLNISKKILMEQLTNLEDTFKKKNEIKICPHCLNSIDFKRIRNKIEELESRKKEFNEKLNSIDNDIKIIERKRNKINDLVLNQKNIPIKIAKLSAEINSLNNIIEKNRDKLENLIKQRKIYSKELAEIKREVKNLQERIISLSTKDDKLREKHTRIISKINYLKEEIDRLMNEKNLLIQKILILPQNYNKLIERIELIIKILENKLEDFYLNFIDFLNSKLKLLLTKLNWSFQDIYIDDELNLIIKNEKGIPQKFSSLSEFEKKSIGILILFIVKVKFYPEYPLMVIDEHLNSADPNRFVNFITYFLKIALESNIKLLVITLLPNELNNQFLNNLEQKQYKDIKIYYKN